MDPVQSGSRSEFEPFSTPPRISVVITTYDEDIYDDFAACVESVLEQTYDDFEVVIVTETDHARKRVVAEFADHNPVVHVHAEESLNLASARNLGAKHASGDVYAFIDDDAIADEHWLQSIADTYVEQGAAAVGGKLSPEWPDSEPTFLPAEFYWLVGVTHRGFREDAGPVRNTFGANISFGADVFDTLGGYNTEFGKDHGHNLQGEETELCARMYRVYGVQLFYEPTAVVTHRVYDWQLAWKWIFDRAYWQGYTKRLLQESVPNSTQTEGDYLRTIFTSSLPSYIKSGVTKRSVVPFIQSVMLIVLTGMVGMGFITASISSKIR